LFSNCSKPHNSLKSDATQKVNQKEDETMDYITKEQAIDLAKKEFIRNGRIVENYNLTVKYEKSHNEWHIIFDPKGIPYPGGTHLVLIDQSTGKVIFRPGE
jgi:hypothetical protein